MVGDEDENDNSGSPAGLYDILDDSVRGSDREVRSDDGTPAQINCFKFEQGSVINYKSNGRQVSVTPVDTTEAVKYKIRELLNK